MNTETLSITRPLTAKGYESLKADLPKFGAICTDAKIVQARLFTDAYFQCTFEVPRAHIESFLERADPLRTQKTSENVRQRVRAFGLILLTGVAVGILAQFLFPDVRPLGVGLLVWLGVPISIHASLKLLG